jgi:hypothetical protein
MQFNAITRSSSLTHLPPRVQPDRYVHARPGKGKPRWGVALLLWAVFGILGVHRFYTRSPRVGLLYFVTLGGCGVLWLMDLKWQVLSLARSLALPLCLSPSLALSLSLPPSLALALAPALALSLTLLRSLSRSLALSLSRSPALPLSLAPSHLSIYVPLSLPLPRRL